MSRVAKTCERRYRKFENSQKNSHGFVIIPKLLQIKHFRNKKLSTLKLLRKVKQKQDYHTRKCQALFETLEGRNFSFASLSLLHFEGQVNLAFPDTPMAKYKIRGKWPKILQFDPILPVRVPVFQGCRLNSSNTFQNYFFRGPHKL